MDERRECLVCSVSITSTRLGMDTCRACASFFKRAVVAGAQYLCRQGTFNCSSTRKNKFMCRHCRLSKCYAVGMVYEGPMRIRLKKASILARVSKEFKAMIARRRVTELEMIMACDNRIKVPAKEPVYMVTASTSFGLFNIAFSESLTFFENAFPTLRKLPKKEQELIFKEYMVKLALVLSYYMTTKLFGDAQTKVMTSVCTCFDREMPLDFYYPGGDGDNKEFFKSSVRSHTTEHADLVLPQLTRSQLTEKEFHALAAIVLTEYETTVSEEAEQLLDEIRHDIFKDLQSNYQNELCLVDFSVRLGHLMTLNYIFQESRSIDKVFARYYVTFFDVYLTDKFVQAMNLYR